MRRGRTFRSRAGRSTVALLVGPFVALFVAVACDNGVESGSGDIAIGIDLEVGQRWTAEGTSVDAGQLCSRGTRHVIEGVDAVTNDVVPVRVWSRIIEGAITLRNTTEITFVVEHTCADGSGSFVTREQWGPDVWSVDSGTGAYRELTGGGELEFAPVDYTEITPLRLYLNGTLER